MAALNDELVRLASSFSIEYIPQKLRCAACNHVAVDGVKLPCCDSAICATCANGLNEVCPVCSHVPVSTGDCRPNRTLRTTVRAWLKTQQAKRSELPVTNVALSQQPAFTAPSLLLDKPQAQDYHHPDSTPPKNSVSGGVREEKRKALWYQRMPPRTKAGLQPRTQADASVQMQIIREDRADDHIHSALDTIQTRPEMLLYGFSSNSSCATGSHARRRPQKDGQETAKPPAPMSKKDSFTKVQHWLAGIGAPMNKQEIHRLRRESMPFEIVVRLPQTVSTTPCQPIASGYPTYEDVQALFTQSAPPTWTVRLPTATAHSRYGIHHLPTELLAMIMAYILRPTELAGLCRVCKIFREVAVPQLYHSVTLRLAESRLVKAAARSFLSSNPGLVHIRRITTISELGQGETEAFRASGQAIQRILSRLPQNKLISFTCDPLPHD